MSKPTTAEEARQAVLLQLRGAHDHHVLDERTAWRRGLKGKAEREHDAATWLLRAYAAERDNPKPAGLS
jgi:hypothetical protein